MIFLASQSARRKQILKQMKIPFRVISSHYREKRIPHLSPEKLVRLHAWGKARQAVISKSVRWVLAADTIVVLGKKILGKPKSLKEAVKMLQKLQGRWHQVYTGMAVYDAKRKMDYQEVVRTRVQVKKMPLKAIRHYFCRVDPFDKAGAYAIQEKPGIIRAIQGSYSNVVGLPKRECRKLLRKAGYGQKT